MTFPYDVDKLIRAMAAGEVEIPRDVAICSMCGEYTTFDGSNAEQFCIKCLRSMEGSGREEAE